MDFAQQNAGGLGKENARGWWYRFQMSLESSRAFVLCGLSGVGSFSQNKFLKTYIGNPKDTGVTINSPWKTSEIPSAMTPVGQLTSLHLSLQF